MRIIGISPLDKDATVSIVEDGKVIFAAGEERYTRKKLQEGFPAKSLESALAYTGLKASDIDMVAYPFFEAASEQKMFMRNIADEKSFLEGAKIGDTAGGIKRALSKVNNQRREEIAGLDFANEKFDKPFLKKAFYKLSGTEGKLSRLCSKRESRLWAESSVGQHQDWQKQLESGLADFGLEDKLRRCEHHLAHSANAFFSSPFDKALIATLDGYGSGLAGSMSIGDGINIRRLHKLDYPHSLGTFYQTVTSSLGYKPSRHEGKIVGLAAYGDPDVLLDLILDRFHQEPGSFLMRESNNIYFSRYLATIFPKIDVAAAYQRALEIVACNYIEHYVKETGVDSLVLSGGVVANVKMNQRIFEIPGVKNIFVYPNMGDGGTGTGAALLLGREHYERPKTYTSVYYGPDYTSDEITVALEQAGLKYEHIPVIEPKIAELIYGGKVVARFNGRMEYGPRALGNRSILYHASEPEVNQWLNHRLGRTEFMPFAPATLYEERERCYIGISGAEHSAEFMTITFDCTDFMKEKCPAAVHIDGTARPQLVREEANPSYYKIIKEYCKLSGVPSIINTSFNMHEEPIVNSPDDAIRAFLDGNLDYLAIGEFLVQHPGVD